MKKLCTILIAFGLLLAGCEKDMESLEVENDLLLKKAGTGYTVPNVFDAEGKYCFVANDPVESLVGKQMEIWMGVGNAKAGTLVGHVRFVSAPDTVIIDLTNTDSDGDGKPDMYPYVADEVHIHFASDVDGIPRTKKGNPIPGQFEYKESLDPTQMLIKIPVDFDNVGAIHITVKKLGGIEGFEFYLPEDPVKVIFEKPGPASYFEMEIISDNAGALKGKYDNWCVNTAITLPTGVEYDALLYSSYEPIPENVVDKPENLDLVNYLINHYNEGTVVELKDENCSSLDEPISEPLVWMDIQKAIWHIIDNEQSDLIPDGWSQERVNAIICDVEENGDGFVPTCDQKILFLIVPIDIDQWPLEDGEIPLPIQLIVGQPTVSSVPVPCADEGGTAWGDGYYGATFPGSKQWATWFEYDAECSN